MSNTDEIKSLELDLKSVSRAISIFNENQVQKMFSRTPKEYIYQRPGRGGQKWSYTQIGYTRRSLDSIFGFNWDFEIETTLGEAFEVALKTKSCVVKGKLTGRVLYGGEWISVCKTHFGRSEVKFETELAKTEDGKMIYLGEGSNRKPKRVATDKPLDFGNDMKAAATDCLKKCAALFGIASDVYEKDDYRDIVIKGSDRHEREISKSGLSPEIVNRLDSTETLEDLVEVAALIKPTLDPEQQKSFLTYYSARKFELEGGNGEDL